MDTDDVIELGSSEDEVEPAPKKAKTRPNAMVHIPTNLKGVTIKPTSLKTVGIKGTTQKAVANFANIAKVNNTTNKHKFNYINPLQATIQKKSNTLNPVSLLKRLNSQQVIINKVTPTVKLISNPPIRINSPRSLNSNCSTTMTKKFSGTVIRPLQTMKPISGLQMSNLIKKKKITPKPKPTGEVLTVELDDNDTSSSSTSSPQWYLRPEEQANLSMKEENNKEPDESKLVEITIEDSPLKRQSKQQNQIENVLSITIDDSPSKAVTDKKNDATASDEEQDRQTNKTPVKSKKKLEYSKEFEAKETIEIEIDPVPQDAPESLNIVQGKLNFVSDLIVEIEDSPVKVINEQTCTPKKDKPQQTAKALDTGVCKDINSSLKNSSQSSEFHPIYQSFIDLCFKLEDSEDMKKIVEKKVKAYYRQCPKEYTESEEFLDMVSGKIISMKAGPEKMYLYMKDIVDELNLQRKMAKSKEQMELDANKEIEKQREKESAIFLYSEESEFDSKRKRQIRKLEKTLKKLHRAIQKLEEQEVDFDDEEDSVYLLTERYKERMVRVHAKFCQLTNTKMPSEPRVQIDPRPGQPTGPAKRLEKWINKKVPVGTPLPFPDFHDVLRCVRDANNEDKLGWNEADIMGEARDLFTRCGSKLQRRRQENEWRLAVSRLTLDTDPAENDEELKRNLEKNRQDANKKVSELLNKYADKQNQLKLEGDEIGDKEAEESPVESEEEEIAEVPLDDKNKRKEVLRRILQEKSKKVSDEKENQPNETPLNIEKNEGKTEITTEETMSQSVVEKSTKDEQKKEVKPGSPKNSGPGEEEIMDITSKDSETEVVNDKEDYNMESDIDELHLLQKLHSENEDNFSTLDSSDSESPIAISDTMESSNDEVNNMSDVISIENSSYSESEMNEGNEMEIIETVDIPDDGSKDASPEPDKPNKTSPLKEKTVQSTNGEYNELIEDILLASSDDETTERTSKIDPSLNLKDGNLSIGETVVEGVDEKNKQNNKNTLITNDSSVIDTTGSDENSEILHSKNNDNADCLSTDNKIDNPNQNESNKEIIYNIKSVEKVLERLCDENAVGESSFPDNSRKVAMEKNTEINYKDTENQTSQNKVSNTDVTMCESGELISELVNDNINIDNDVSNLIEVLGNNDSKATEENSIKNKIESVQVL